ncbi:hypothetical protein BLOT_005261 [Blomia tropicalis]|nr:hypothetical protein BLOT_005261 [Blomia tropicalis]
MSIITTIKTVFVNEYKSNDFSFVLNLIMNKGLQLTPFSQPKLVPRSMKYRFLVSIVGFLSSPKDGVDDNYTFADGMVQIVKKVSDIFMKSSERKCSLIVYVNCDQDSQVSLQLL